MHGPYSTFFGFCGVVGPECRHANGIRCVGEAMTRNVCFVTLRYPPLATAPLIRYSYEVWEAVISNACDTLASHAQQLQQGR